MRSIIHSLYCVTLGRLVWAGQRALLQANVAIASLKGFVSGALAEIYRRR